MNWANPVRFLAMSTLAACLSAFGSLAPSSSVRVFGWGFANPEAVSSDGTHVWVANEENNSVVELNAVTGGRLRVLWGASYGLDDPEAIASDGAHVWVVNGGPGDSVAELSAVTGDLVQVISGPRSGIDGARGHRGRWHPCLGGEL